MSLIGWKIVLLMHHHAVLKEDDGDGDRSGSRNLVLACHELQIQPRDQEVQNLRFGQ